MDLNNIFGNFTKITSEMCEEISKKLNRINSHKKDDPSDITPEPEPTQEEQEIKKKFPFYHHKRRF